MMDSGLTGAVPRDPRGQRALGPGLGYEERLVEWQADNYEAIESGGKKAQKVKKNKHWK